MLMVCLQFVFELSICLHKFIIVFVQESKIQIAHY